MYAIRSIHLTLLAVFMVSGGCGSVTAADPDASLSVIDAESADTPEISIAVVDRLRVRQDGSATIAVEVTRTAFEGAVRIEISGLPTGVSAQALEIAAGESTGMLSLSAAGATVTAAPINTTVTATAVDDAALMATIGAPLYVAGPSGAYDTSFSFDGIALYGVTDREYDATKSLAIDSQGRIYVAGSGQGGAANLGWVVRLLPDGSLDEAFANAGIYTDFLLVGDDRSAVSDLFLHSDDSVRVLAQSSDGSDSTIYLRALDSAGVIDPSFSVTGDSRITENVTRIRQRTSGYLIGGTNEVMAMSSAGAADSAFTLAANLPSNFGDMAVDSSDQVVFGGFDADGFTLTRLLSDGALDTSFGTGGSTTAVQPTGNISPVINHIMLFPDNSGVAMGESNLNDNDYSTNVPVMLRFGADGQLDTGFGTQGVAPVLASGQLGFGTSLALQEDGLILGTGAIRLTQFTFNNVLKRFNPDGSVDSSFGTDGSVALEENVRALVIDANAGRALVLGEQSGGTGGIHLTRIWL